MKYTIEVPFEAKFILEVEARSPVEAKDVFMSAAFSLKEEGVVPKWTATNCGQSKLIDVKVFIHRLVHSGYRIIDA